MLKSNVPNGDGDLSAHGHLGDPTWLTNLRERTLSNDIHSLGTTINSLLDDIEPNNWSEIDLKLASVDVAIAPPSHLVAVLTSLFTWRDVLKEWPGLRDRALCHYKGAGVQGAEVAFKGLV